MCRRGCSTVIQLQLVSMVEVDVGGKTRDGCALGSQNDLHFNALKQKRGSLVASHQATLRFLEGCAWSKYSISGPALKSADRLMLEYK